MFKTKFNSIFDIIIIQRIIWQILTPQMLIQLYFSALISKIAAKNKTNH